MMGQTDGGGKDGSGRKREWKRSIASTMTKRLEDTDSTPFSGFGKISVGNGSGSELNH